MPATFTETIITGLKAGMTNAEVLTLVKSKHPRSKLGLASINHYRNQFRKKGAKFASDREIKRGRNR